MAVRAALPRAGKGGAFSPPPPAVRALPRVEGRGLVEAGFISGEGKEVSHSNAISWSRCEGIFERGIFESERSENPCHFR